MGSRRWFAYPADNGQVYAVNLDESNSEATINNGGAVSNPLFVNLAATATLPVNQLPKGTKMRYINTFLQSNPAVKRVFKCGSLAAFAFAAGPSTISASYSSDGSSSGTAVTWVVSSRVGEKGRIANFATDTGQTDGDAAGNA